jgi:hypothetical protein
MSRDETLAEVALRVEENPRADVEEEEAREA